MGERITPTIMPAQYVMLYEYDIGYHKGAFQALLNLKNVVEHFQSSVHSKLVPKKVYKLLLSYLDEACHNIDEFMQLGGLDSVIIDKDNVCKYVTEEEAEAFRAKCRKQAEERQKKKDSQSQ